MCGLKRSLVDDKPVYFCETARYKKGVCDGVPWKKKENVILVETESDRAKLEEEEEAVDNFLDRAREIVRNDIKKYISCEHLDKAIEKVKNGHDL